MTLTQILKDHGIQVKESCGRLLAFEEATQFHADGSNSDASEWVDVTDWSMTTVKHWLGY